MMQSSNCWKSVSCMTKMTKGSYFTVNSILCNLEKAYFIVLVMDGTNCLNQISNICAKGWMKSKTSGASEVHTV